MRVAFIEHEGKQILLHDYRGAATEQELLAVLNEGPDALRRSAGGVLLLADYTGIHVTGKYMETVKSLGREIIRDKAARTAVLGITGVKTILLSGYVFFTGDQNTRAFDAEAEAKDWLVS